MLNQYLLQTAQLLQNPQAPVSLYSAADLTGYINTARGQIAGETRCIRSQGELQTIVGQREYYFTQLVFGDPGIAGALHIRSVFYFVAQGMSWVPPVAWPWFELYSLNQPLPQNAVPQRWAQYAPGFNGSFWLDPPPDALYTLFVDSVCLPLPLVTDTDFEAIPPLWTDSVPYFAAYIALLAAQTGQRQADADRMFARYEEFAQRARRAASSDVATPIFEQTPDPAAATRYGLQQKQGGG